MRKIYLLLFILACSFGYLQAQAWYVYDGSAIPSDLDEWNTSSNNPGPNMVEAVLDDPEISGNKIFQYVQPDDSAITLDNKARKLYRHPFDSAKASGGQVTVVARLKGYSVDTLDVVTEIQVHNSTTSYREYLQVNSVDSTVKLARSGDVAKLNMDLNKWHIYRFVVNGQDSTATVYVDEDPTAVLTGTNDNGTSEDYLRMGDGGGARTAGYTDWVIIDTTGLYAPGEGAAIPDSLSTETGGADLPGLGKTVLFITDETQIAPHGNYPDSMAVVDLEAAGFTVNRPSYSIVSDASAELVAAAEAADMVVVGRAVNSGEFKDPAEVAFWNKLQKPVVILSNYLMRSNRLDWIASTGLLNYSRFGDLPGKVHLPEDPAFDGVTIPSDSIIVFATDHIGMIEMDEAAQAANNGTVLVSLINGPEAYEMSNSSLTYVDTVQLSDWDGNPLMIRWEPLDTMYSGGSAVPFGWRTFITGGNDSDWDEVNERQWRDTYPLSPEMRKVLVNECAYLLTLEQPVLDDDATLSALSVDGFDLDPAFDPATNNYIVIVPTSTTSATITATPNSVNAEVTGDVGEFTEIPGTAAITVTAQTGTVNTYNVVFQLEIDPNAECIPGGTGTLESAVAQASDGDTLVLCNDAEYVLIESITIDKKLVFRAADYPELPGLDSMPLIINSFTVTPMFQMADGSELHMIGIDIDGNGCSNLINPRTGGTGGVISMFFNRCRLHNTASDIINSADNDQETVLASFKMMNTFLYDGTEHGAYIRNFHGTNDPYEFEDVTYWNLGQQMVWISHNTGEGDPQEWIFNHMTGYNLSTNTGSPKELYGNSDGAGPVDVTMKNTILSKQNSGDASLAFYQTSTSGDVITLSNLVLYDVKPVTPREGSDATPVDPLYEDDPQFADPDNGNFTVGNTNYLTAADDGGVLGARYWHPDFVDDFSDVSTGGTPVDEYKTANLKVNVYPVPFSSDLTFEFSMEKACNVTVNIVDISGRTVKIFNGSFDYGTHQVTMDLESIEAGSYFYTIKAGEKSNTGHLVKAE